MTVVLYLHYSYYSLVISRERLNLHLASQEAGCPRELESGHNRLASAARSIVNLRPFIVAEPHTPIL